MGGVSSSEAIFEAARMDTASEGTRGGREKSQGLRLSLWSVVSSKEKKEGEHKAGVGGDWQLAVSEAKGCPLQTVKGSLATVD